MALHQRQGADPIPDQRRRLEIQSFRCILHLGGQSLLHVVATTRQKNPSLVDQRRVVFAADPTHAWGAAPLDLVQQARAGADSEDAVAAGSQQKRLL